MGVNCKCIHGNGVSGRSNGNGVNGGKITVEFTVYGVEGYEGSYVMQNDIEKFINEILNVDPNKFAFYLMAISISSPDGVNINAGACVSKYVDYYRNGIFNQWIYIDMNNINMLKIVRENGIINWDKTTFATDEIVSTLPGEVLNEGIRKIILYYREI